MKAQELLACKDQKPTQAPLRKVGFILKMLKIISTSLHLKWTSWLLENSQVVSLSLSLLFCGGRGDISLKKNFFDKGSEAIYLFVCFPAIVTLFLEEARRNGEHSTPVHLITKTASSLLFLICVHFILVPLHQTFLLNYFHVDIISFTKLALGPNQSDFLAVFYSQPTNSLISRKRK